MRRMLIVGGVVLTGAVLIFFVSGISSDRGIVLKPDDQLVVSLGAEVYQQNCASCHGKNLQGEEDWQGRDDDGRLRAPPHDATGHTWHHDGELLFRLTKYGPAEVLGNPDYATNMPSYEDVLSDDDIIAVLSYIKSTWPPHIPGAPRRNGGNAMRLKSIALAALILLPGNAFGHSKAEQTTPGNNETVQAVEVVEIRFDDPMRVTAVSLTGPDGDVEIKRETGLEPVTEFRAIPGATMGAGVYQVDWRGLAADGHPMQGSFTFTIAE